MKKTLASLVLGASAMFGGCSSQPEPVVLKDNAIHLDTSRYSSGHGVGSTNSARDTRISLDYVALGGKEYLVENKNNNLPNQANFVLYPLTGTDKGETFLVENLSTKKANLERKTLFVPTQWDLDNDGTPEREMKFSDKEGVYKVVAKIKERNSNRLLDVGTITEKDIDYNIKTSLIGGQGEFYVGIILEDDGSRIKSTLITPKENAEILININSGQITIRNPNRIYELVEKNIEDYDKEIIELKEKQKKEEERRREEKETIEKARRSGVPQIDVPLIEIPDKNTKK